MCLSIGDLLLRKGLFEVTPALRWILRPEIEVEDETRVKSFF